MSAYPSLTICPQCHRLRNPKGPCPYCQRRQRHVRGLAFAAGILGLILLTLLLSSCTPEMSVIQPPATPIPTVPAGPPAQTGAQLSSAWRQWANQQGYCWCEIQGGQPILVGESCAREVLDIDRAAHLCPPQ